MHIMLSLKLGYHQVLTLFIHGQLLKRTLVLVLPPFLIRILIRAFLNVFPVYAESSPGLPGATWPLLAGPAATNPRKLSIGFAYFALFLLLSVLLVKLV